MAAYRWTVDMADRIVSLVLEESARTLFYTFKVLSDSLARYREGRGYVDKFDKKFSEEELFLMAVSLPASSPLTIKGVWGVWPHLSKNHAAKVAAIRKDTLGSFRRIFKKNPG